MSQPWKWFFCSLLVTTLQFSTAPAHAGIFSNLRSKAKETPAADTATTRTEKAKPAPQRTTPKVAASVLATEKFPADFLSRYQGRWKGDLWVYSPKGNLRERHKLQIDCEVGADGKLTMTTYDFDEVGRKMVIIESSTYQLVSPDKVIVKIKRPNGKEESQTGRFNDDAMFLVAERPDGVEHFRERIIDNKMYLDGYGIYGSYKDLDKHQVTVARLKR